MADINLSLTEDEALVLFEILSRYVESGILGTQDQSEQRAIWNLQCLLENQLVAPCSPEYAGLSLAAQNALRDDGGMDATYEQEHGRLAFWLLPDDIKFIVGEWRKMSPDADDEDRERWGDIAFRAMSTLNKAGIDYKATAPSVQYQVVPRDDDGSDTSAELVS